MIPRLRFRLVGSASMALLAACRSGTTAAPAGPPPSASVSGDAGARAEASAEASADTAPKADPNAGTDASAKAGPDAGGPPDMLLVPGGTFTMGSESGGEADERPAHPVTLSAFWLDRAEVTQHAYDACVSANACPAPDGGILSSLDGVFKGPNKPVIGVSWYAARDYCKWKGKRLPGEAEYERAVRGEDGRRYPWGTDTPTRERSVFAASATEDVATHPLGRGPYGHDDLAGNVWEWIEDDYDPLAYSRPGAPEGKPGSCAEILAAQDKLRAENKQGFTGSNPIPTSCEKSIRGGAYNYPANGLRSTNRVHHPPTFRLRMTGLRCAKSAT